jgi:hypothetical protein
MWSGQQPSIYKLKTKKWKLWKAGVCQAMTEDVNGAVSIDFIV